MTHKIAAYVVGSSLGWLMLAQATDPSPAINTAYAFKDLTLSGVLAVAVWYLYRKLEKKEKDVTEFVAQQTKAMKEFAEGQSAALGQVSQALDHQKSALDAVIAMQRDHINRILDRTIDKKNTSQ